MTSTQHRKGNDALRGHLDTIIPNIPEGKDIRTAEMVSALQKINRKYEIDNKRISRLMRERDDLVWVRLGVFRKVPA